MEKGGEDFFASFSLAEEAGRRVMDLLWKDIKARDIMTPAHSITQ